jgi:hypothetical protein
LLAPKVGPPRPAASWGLGTWSAAIVTGIAPSSSVESVLYLGLPPGLLSSAALVSYVVGVNAPGGFAP